MFLPNVGNDRSVRMITT